MILPDWRIETLCGDPQKPLISPFRKDQLNPASYDLRLGRTLMIEVADTPEMMVFDISDRTADDPYRLMPGEFCLAESAETFNIPNHLSAQFKLKSSRGREGYGHALAGFCDPGWQGSVLTLELHNSRRFHDLKLYPGLKIGQMIFSQMLGCPLKSYAETGRYNNDTAVTQSRG